MQLLRQKSLAVKALSCFSTTNLPLVRWRLPVLPHVQAKVVHDKLSEGFPAVALSHQTGNLNLTENTKEKTQRVSTVGDVYSGINREQDTITLTLPSGLLRQAEPHQPGDLLRRALPFAVVLLVQGRLLPDAAEQAEVGGGLEVQLLLGPAQLLAGHLPGEGNKPQTLHLPPGPRAPALGCAASP